MRGAELSWATRRRPSPGPGWLILFLLRCARVVPACRTKRANSAIRDFSSISGHEIDSNRTVLLQARAKRTGVSCVSRLDHGMEAPRKEILRRICRGLQPPRALPVCSTPKLRPAGVYAYVPRRRREDVPSSNSAVGFHDQERTYADTHAC
jgi:hypothetical protein